jgi:N-succinyl-L-ornithine transcarbamylase
MVDSAKMQLTNNAKFMHCLPVRRNMIVSDDVIEGAGSIVVPQAANRVVSAQVVIREMLKAL